MEDISLDLSSINDFIDKELYNSLLAKMPECLDNLRKANSLGANYTGWVNQDVDFEYTQIDKIISSVNRLKEKVNTLVVIGIGGSYLGSKAIIDALSNDFSNSSVLFAGHNLNSSYLHNLAEYLQSREFGICIISKSGTTTEPAIAFRFLKSVMESKYSSTEIKERIIAITDKSEGALRQLAENESYESFYIPDNIGGRYSIFTPVGLYPIAFAGFDIKQFLEGSIRMCDKVFNSETIDNIAFSYVCYRNMMYSKGKKIEILANYNYKLNFVSEWWKQLFGESEGKDGKGIFPVSLCFSTDLHSMGQYIQDGERHLFETLISVKKPKNDILISKDIENLDNLNYLSGQSIDYVNKMALKGAKKAHVSGGVPVVEILLPCLNEYYMGQLLYFFMISCGLSGYILGVNPFDQPGVEDYKRNMFSLLKKPGF
ncbi:MAG: glucose-6-phosphate isomerase [Marinifilaceae bacterium]|jgi:glucose-6-phosphate isomerase|nr:glucose-6-phosphate isomerase [Marinifilaceae bacterium]